MNKFIDWSTLDFKKQSGKEKIRCPSCDESRSDKRDKSLQINHNDGFGKCHYCESLTFKEDKIKSLNEKNYTNIENKPITTVLSEEKILNYISSRKINKSTLDALYVSFEKHYQPAKNKEVDNIVFNYYEGSKLVNKKFRSSDKKFTQISGAKPIFYNINSTIGQDEVYIVEGEFDVLALYEFGIKNVISVPNGANDNDEYWINSEKYLKEIKHFIIAVDNDEKGNDLKEKIAQRLGRYRCSFIEWENKDANGDLIDGCIEQSIKSKKRFPISGTFTVSDLKDGILDLYDNGLPDTISPKCYRFRGLKEVFSIMLGQLTVVTGIPSHGKSNFVDDYVLNLSNDYNFKCSWFSPEHSPMQLYQTNLMEKVLGRNFWKDKVSERGETIPRITKQEINEYEKWANERIYLTGAEGNTIPDWDWLLEKFKEQMLIYGINIFVIDAFNKVMMPKGNRLDMINEVLTKLTHFTQSNNVAVILVAHPTKMKKDEKGLYETPTLYDVSGSADFRNQTHNGFTIYRYFDEDGIEGYTEFTNMKTKFNFQGNIGDKMNFSYSKVNGRFYSKGSDEPFFSLIGYNPEHPKELPEVIPLKTIHPKDAFLEEDEMPF